MSKTLKTVSPAPRTRNQTWAWWVIGLVLVIGFINGLYKFREQRIFEQQALEQKIAAIQAVRKIRETKAEKLESIDLIIFTDEFTKACFLKIDAYARKIHNGSWDYYDCRLPGKLQSTDINNFYRGHKTNPGVTVNHMPKLKNGSTFEVYWRFDQNNPRKMLDFQYKYSSFNLNKNSWQVECTFSPQLRKQNTSSLCIQLYKYERVLYVPCKTIHLYKSDFPEVHRDYEFSDFFINSAPYCNQFQSAENFRDCQCNVLRFIQGEIKKEFFEGSLPRELQFNHLKPSSSFVDSEYHFNLSKDNALADTEQLIQFHEAHYQQMYSAIQEAVPFLDVLQEYPERW